MNLYINSPSYYSTYHQIDNEIYKMCLSISKSIDITKYTDVLDTIGITPIIAPSRETNDTMYAEVKLINLAYRFASISLRTNYETYISANIEEKKVHILNNIFSSLLYIKKRLGNKFDYELIKKDIMLLL